MLFPAEKKNALPYEGHMEVTDVIKFVADHGSNSHHLVHEKGSYLWTGYVKTNANAEGTFYILSPFMFFFFKASDANLLAWWCAVFCFVLFLFSHLCDHFFFHVFSSKNIQKLILACNGLLICWLMKKYKKTKILLMKDVKCLVKLYNAQLLCE